MISRSIDKVEEHEDISRYVNSGQAIPLAADLREVRPCCSFKYIQLQHMLHGTPASHLAAAALACSPAG